jgi:hypothetical protein
MRASGSGFFSLMSFLRFFARADCRSRPPASERFSAPGGKLGVPETSTSVAVASEAVAVGLGAFVGGLALYATSSEAVSLAGMIVAQAGAAAAILAASTLLRETTVLREIRVAYLLLVGGLIVGAAAIDLAVLL